jgi:hypothetical protein
MGFDHTASFSQRVISRKRMPHGLPMVLGRGAALKGCAARTGKRRL